VWNAAAQVLAWSGGSEEKGARVGEVVGSRICRRSGVRDGATEPGVHGSSRHARRRRSRVAIQGLPGGTHEAATREQRGRNGSG
jgi:hypothetical protein